jgi:hypothetical protein
MQGVEKQNIFNGLDLAPTAAALWSLGSPAEDNISTSPGGLQSLGLLRSSN